MLNITLVSGSSELHPRRAVASGMGHLMAANILKNIMFLGVAKYEET